MRRLRLRGSIGTVFWIFYFYTLDVTMRIGADRERSIELQVFYSTAISPSRDLDPESYAKNGIRLTIDKETATVRHY
jgi:hypothetical protein